jgi:hypothetical protein
MIDECFSAESLQSVRDPTYDTRVIDSAKDLSFGEYVRLIEEPSRWSHIGWTIDRGVFRDALDKVRSIRNEVMHFSPDLLDADQTAVLVNFIRLLRTLDPRP